MTLRYKLWTSISITMLILTFSSQQVYAQNPDLTLRCENTLKQKVKFLGFNQDRTKVSTIVYINGAISTFRTRFALDVNEYTYKYSWTTPSRIGGSGTFASIDRNSLRLTFRRKSRHTTLGWTMLSDEDIDCEIENNNLIFLRALQDYNQYLDALKKREQQRLEDRKF